MSYKKSLQLAAATEITANDSRKMIAFIILSKCVFCKNANHFDLLIHIVPKSAICNKIRYLTSIFSRISILTFLLFVIIIHLRAYMTKMSIIYDVFECSYNIYKFLSLVVFCDIIKFHPF